jgi:hypothetical protein
MCYKTWPWPFFPSSQSITFSGHKPSQAVLGIRTFLPDLDPEFSPPDPDPTLIIKIRLIKSIVDLSLRNNYLLLISTNIIVSRSTIMCMHFIDFRLKSSDGSEKFAGIFYLVGSGSLATQHGRSDPDLVQHTVDRIRSHCSHTKSLQPTGHYGMKCLTMNGYNFIAILLIRQFTSKIMLQMIFTC